MYEVINDGDHVTVVEISTGLVVQCSYVGGLEGDQVARVTAAMEKWAAEQQEAE